MTVRCVFSSSGSSCVPVSSRAAGRRLQQRAASSSPPARRLSRGMSLPAPVNPFDSMDGDTALAWYEAFIREGPVGSSELCDGTFGGRRVQLLAIPAHPGFPDEHPSRPYSSDALRSGDGRVPSLGDLVRALARAVPQPSRHNLWNNLPQRKQLDFLAHQFRNSKGLVVAASRSAILRSPSPSLPAPLVPHAPLLPLLPSLPPRSQVPAPAAAPVAPSSVPTHQSRERMLTRSASAGSLPSHPRASRSSRSLSPLSSSPPSLSPSMRVNAFITSSSPVVLADRASEPLTTPARVSDLCVNRARGLMDMQPHPSLGRDDRSIDCNSSGNSCHPNSILMSVAHETTGDLRLTGASSSLSSLHADPILSSPHPPRPTLASPVLASGPIPPDTSHVVHAHGSPDRRRTESLTLSTRSDGLVGVCVACDVVCPEVGNVWDRHATGSPVGDIG